MQEKSKKINKTLIATLVSTCLVAGTLVTFGLLKYRNMYVSSVIVIALIMVPFFVSFEERKIKAKDLVTLAIMCAVAVMSRVAFIWAPNFKPIAGIIIITGMAFGPSTGFIAGAISMLASNMMFGQGLWTPWQMFAFGLIGLIAGALSKAGVMKKERRVLNAVISFFLYFVVCGPILDTASVFLMPQGVEIGKILAIYLAGMVVNLEQAATTLVTVLLLGKPILDKLDRLKTKYGVLTNEI